MLYNPPGKPFAAVQIEEVRREMLGDISPQDASAEGYDSEVEYLAAFDCINGPTPRSTPVWVVTQKLVEALDASCDRERSAGEPK